MEEKKEIKIRNKLLINGKEIEDGKTELSFSVESESGEYVQTLKPDEMPVHNFDCKYNVNGISIDEALLRIKKIEQKEYKEDRSKGIPVRINPYSYLAKEIEYQSILMHKLLVQIEEIKRLLDK